VRRRRVDVWLPCRRRRSRCRDECLVLDGHVRSQVKRALIHADAGHPDHALVVGTHLRVVVIGECPEVRVDVLVELQVRVREGMRMCLVPVMDMLLRHDWSDDQTGRKCERNYCAAEQGTHAGIMGSQPRGSQTLAMNMEVTHPSLADEAS